MAAIAKPTRTIAGASFRCYEQAWRAAGPAKRHAVAFEARELAMWLLQETGHPAYGDLVNCWADRLCRYPRPI